MNKRTTNLTVLSWNPVQALQSYLSGSDVTGSVRSCSSFLAFISRGLLNPSHWLSQQPSQWTVCPCPFLGRLLHALTTPAPATSLFFAPASPRSIAKAALPCLSSAPSPSPSISQFLLLPWSFHDHAIPLWASSTWFAINIPIAQYITFVIGSTPFQDYFRYYLVF